MTSRDDTGNRSPPNNDQSASPPTNKTATSTVRTTHAQHGIYNALLNTTSSSSTQTLNELQILEKSISLTAAAPPLKLAPPFPGACNALTSSIISAVQQQRQRAQQQNNQNQNQHQMLMLGGISNRVAEENASAWRDADPSKTHAVVVALCLGRAAWDFPSDDAPVDLVNKGAPPLLAVDIGDNNNNGGENKNNKNNKSSNNNTQNIFGTTTNHHNAGQDGNFQQGQNQGGVAFYLDNNNNGNNNNGNQNGNNGNNGGGGGNNNNQRIVILNQSNLNQQQAALAVLQALAAKDAALQQQQQNAKNNKEMMVTSTSPTNANNNEDGGNNNNTVSGGGGGDTSAHSNNNNDQQQHQIALQAAVAAANNTNQPTIHPPGAPSTLYSWRALRAHSDVANRSCARAGEGLEALYLEMMKQRPESKNVKVITPLVNPTTENIRDVLHKGATDATDDMHRRVNLNRQRGVLDGYGGPNKILLHYVGHGVPRPERGCMYFARQATQRQHHAFSPVRDILHLLGTPCMLLCDCASAGNIRSAIVAVERELNPYSNNTTPKENRFFWGSCADGEPLPHHPLMPDDLFSSIMVSPIRMAVLFFIVQRKNLYDLPPYLIHVFANEWGVGLKAGSPVAEVRNAFNAIVESIAAKVLSPDVFYVCFRQDAVVMNLFRAFILAQRIIGSLGCEPCSHPHIPPDTTSHALWQSFDLVVEGVLGSIMRQWRPKPSHGLSVHAFRMSLDPTLVMKNMPEPPQVPISSFFHDSLVSLQGQFDSAQALALAGSSIVEAPSASQSHHTDLLVHQQYQNHLFHLHQKIAAAAAQQYGRPSNNFQYYNHNQFNGGGGGGSSGGGSSYHHPSYGNRFSDSEQASSYDSSGTGGASDFASYLLSRSSGINNNNNKNSATDPSLMMSMAQNDDFQEQQQQYLFSQNDEFPSRDLIGFVGTRFPILQHAIVGRDTRFFGLVILARWLDLGSLAVECCELFGFFREMLWQLWHLAKPVDDQDPLMVMIGAKTCMVDPRLLVVQKSLQVPMNYCARVFVSPQEPKDQSKLGILGQVNTQRWFSAATIALTLLRQQNLVYLGTFVTPINNNNNQNQQQQSNTTAQQQQQLQLNPYSTSISLKFQCPTAKTCIEILETTIPAKSRNAPDSDSEPSIASNLKSGCLAVLGCIAFTLRDTFSNAYPSLSAVASATTSTLQQQNTNNQQPRMANQQQMDPYQQAQQLQLFQLQHLQLYLQYQPNDINHKQLYFLTQFLLPSMKASWIDGVGVLLTHKDSTPRIRWGSARTLHIFLNILNKIQTEALLAQQHVHLITSNVLGGNSNNLLGSPTGPLLALNTSLSNSTISTPVTQHPGSGTTSIPITPPDQMRHADSSDALHQQQYQQIFNNPQHQQSPNVLFLQSFYPQVQQHLAFLHELAETCQSLQVSVVSRLVTHSLRLEGNIDVRREILGALTAFCLCQTDTMLSRVIQSEMRAMFTGTASPNRFGFASSSSQQNQQNQQSTAGSTLANPNPNNNSTNPNTISPGSEQLLKNLKNQQQQQQPQKQFLNPNQPVTAGGTSTTMRRTSDFDPTLSANLSQQHLLGNTSNVVVSSNTTPQVSAINTPMRPHHGGGAGGGDGGSFLSRGASKLDYNNNNNSLVSPSAGGGNVVRSVPFNQQNPSNNGQNNNAAQQNLFDHNNNNNVATTPKSQQQRMDSQVFDLSAETNIGHNNHNNNGNQTFSMDDFCPSFEQLGEMFIANNNNNSNNVKKPTKQGTSSSSLVDRRTIVLLLAVRWIVSLRQDAHPVLRVLCIRALQKFVAEKFITLGLFSRPKNPNANNSSSAAGVPPRADSVTHTNNNNNNNNNRYGSGLGPHLGHHHQQNHHNNDDDDEHLDHTHSNDEDDDDPLGYGSSSQNKSNRQQSINDSFSPNKNPVSQQQQKGKGVFDRLTDFFGGGNKTNNSSNNKNPSQQQPAVRGILANNNNQNNGSHVDPYTSRANPSDLDKFLFSETDASILFDFEAPPLSLLDLESTDIAMVEFVNEMLRALAKPVIPRFCQRISLGDLPARFSRPQTTAAAITAACSAPLIGDVAPHRCVFHSYVRRTLSHAKSARNETALSDIVQRHVYPGIDAAHVVFHPNEPFAVCCSHDEVLSVVSTAPRDKRVYLSERMDRILPNGVDETDFGFGANHHQNSSRLGGAGGGGGHGDSSDGDSFRTPRAAGGFFGNSSGGAGAGGGLNALSSNAAGGAPKKTSAVVLLDVVYSHTAAVVASDSCVRIVTDIANRGGIRIATAFQGLSSSFDTAAASLPHFASPNSSPSNFTASQQHHQHSSANSNISSSSLAAYQALGQRLIVTGDGHRFALWDIGQQRKLDERFALPASVTAQITSLCPFAASPESFVLGLTKSIAITDHRMKDATAGTLHIPQAFAGAGCVSIMSHPGSQNKITGISYSGLTCIWDVRYAMEIGEGRSILPGYGQTTQTLQPGLTRHSLPRAGYLPGVSAPSSQQEKDASSAGVQQVTTAAIHPLFSEAPLVAGGISSKFKVTLPDQVLAHRNDYYPITCAWHPFEVVGAVVPWTSEKAQRRLEIFAAASKDQRADHIVDLIL